MQKASLILSFMSVSLFSMELEVVQHTQNAKKRHIDSSTFTPNQLGSLNLSHGKKESYIHQDDKRELGFALHSPLDIIDINAIVTRHLIQNNDDFAQAVHDVRAISLITKNSVFFLSEQGAIDTIALTLSHKFKINKPLVVKTLNMKASKQWLACFQKSINANDLLAKALINDDARLALESLNSGANVDAFNPSLSDPALVYAVKKLNPEMVRFLIKNGSDINIRGQQGETALIVAAKCDDATNGMKMLNVINEFHPNKSLKDNNGLTAIDWVMLRS